ncbi:uncharacterized protein LOC128558773 isoform X1 [Mercenaria mercenaria]|uniref:uncharacterized protein LOC128558773 isoform X1 n=1 Tax=Mercenaria mercenaria TaxID=6596 RepID=UPI00234F9FC6|nr:uncharacterized protein LOC128558773 isoform X1 [Mercenaria mercenaria]
MCFFYFTCQYPTKFYKIHKPSAIARMMYQIYNTWPWKDVVVPGIVILLLFVCIWCCKRRKRQQMKLYQIEWFQRCWSGDKWRTWMKSHISGLAKTKTCIVRSKGVDLDIETQLQKIGINVTKDLRLYDNGPIIALRYSGVSRLEDDISGCLGDFSDEEIERTILMLLYESPMGYDVHGSVEDPKQVPYSSETQNNYRYKKLKGIIHLQLDNKGKINFKNCDAGNILKNWIKKIETA